MIYAEENEEDNIIVVHDTMDENEEHDFHPTKKTPEDIKSQKIKRGRKMYQKEKKG